MSIELMNGFKVRLLQAKVPLLRQLTIGLYKNDFTLEGDSTLDDLVEVDWVGYSRKTIAWPNPAFSLDDGVASMTARRVIIGPMTRPTLQNLYGWFGIDELGFLALGDRLRDQDIIKGPLQQWTVALFATLLEDTMRGI